MNTIQQVVCRAWSWGLLAPSRACQHTGHETRYATAPMLWQPTHCSGTTVVKVGRGWGGGGNGRGVRMRRDASATALVMEEGLYVVGTCGGGSVMGRATANVWVRSNGAVLVYLPVATLPTVHRHPNNAESGNSNACRTSTTTMAPPRPTPRISRMFVE